MSDLNPSKPQQMEVKSLSQLWGALVPSASLGLIFLVTFLLLHNRFPDIYDPKRLRIVLLDQSRHRPCHGYPQEWQEEGQGGPPGLFKSFPSGPPQTLWSWFWKMWRMKDREIISYLGVDAFIFLRFLRLGLHVSFVAMLLGLLLILPVNIHGGNHLKQLERLSLANVSEKSNLLWVHVVVAYVLTAFVLYRLYQEYLVFLRLRQRYLMTPTAQSYSLLLQDIPRGVSPRLLRQYLFGLLGQDLTALHIIHTKDYQEYERLIREKDKNIRILSRAIQEHQNTGRRPRYRESLHCLGHTLDWLPLGPYVDTLTSKEEEIQRINRQLQALSDRRKRLDGGGETKEEEEAAALEDRRQNDEPTEDVVPAAAILTMDTIRVTQAYLAICLQQDLQYFSVVRCPAPEDLLWENAASSPGRCFSHRGYLQRTMRSFLVWLLVLALILGYTVPVGFVASLANLTALSRTRYFHWLQPILAVSPTLTSFIQGFLPPLILSIFLSLVPEIMKKLSHQQLLLANSECENSAIFKVYLFSLLGVFLAYTIAGSFFSKIQQLSHLAGHPADIVSLFATTLPAQSTFFINFIMVGTFSNLPSEVLRLGPFVMMKLRESVGGRGRRSLWDDLQLLHQDLGFHYLYGFPLLVFLAFLTYALVAPLLNVFALVYFIVAYPIWLHQLLYVYQPSAHTGGTQWPVVFGCCVSALCFQQILMIGVLGLKRSTIASALMVPLLIFTLTFGIRFQYVCRPLRECVTLENLTYADRAVLSSSSLQALRQAYIPSPDEGGKEELSTKELKTLSEPFGIILQGVFDNFYRPIVEKMNTTKLVQDLQEEVEEEKEEQPDEKRPQHDLPAYYGSTDRSTNHDTKQDDKSSGWKEIVI